VVTDERHLRAQLRVIFLTVFLDLLGFGIVIPILPLYAEKMHATDREIGILLAVYSFMQLFFAPLWGRVSDRVGRRPVLLVSIAGSMLSQLGYALAPSFAWLVVARGVAGVCGANIAAAQAYVADVTEEHDRARGMGTLGAALGLGFVFGPGLGGLLGRLSETLPFFVASGLAALNFCAAFLVLREPKPLRERSHARAISKDGLLRAIGKPRLLWAVLLFFVVTFGFSNLEATFSLYLERRFGYGRREASLLFAYIGLFIVFVQGGLVRRLVPRFGERRLIIAGNALMALGFVMLARSYSLFALLVSLAVTSIGNAINTPSLSALISRLAADDTQGGVLGVSQSAGALARIAGPLVGTAMLAYGITAPYALGALALLCAAVLAVTAIVQPVARSRAEAQRTG
jgi:multidrug resistance protein